jgi:hypothetical protein
VGPQTLGIDLLFAPVLAYDFQEAAGVLFSNKLNPASRIVCTGSPPGFHPDRLVILINQVAL